MNTRPSGQSLYLWLLGALLVALAIFMTASVNQVNATAERTARMESAFISVDQRLTRIERTLDTVLDRGFISGGKP